MDIKKVLNEVAKEIEQSSSQQELQNVKGAYLGKKGKITELLKSLKDLSLEEKKSSGSKLNLLRIEVDNLIDGTGDDKAMGDNGDDIFFLPGDDFVEWVYDEDSSDISPPPLCPGDPSCNSGSEGFARTGSNVGRLIIILGSLLMMAGGFILSRGYRF